MITTAILNVTLALGVVTIVVTPLVWAILTQHRDHRGLRHGERAASRDPQPRVRRPAARPYTPAAGRV